MKYYNNEKYIVSFTSFGERFNSACKMIYSLQKQTYKNFHLVMTVWEGDVKDMTPEIKMLIKNNFLEIIVAEENLCPHLKYYYAMKKYNDKPIITVDDDRIYSFTLLEKLVEKYESLDYKSIISTSAPIIKIFNNNVLNESEWCNPFNRLKPNKKSYLAMAEGFGGILYPSNCFNINDIKIDEIKKIIYHDDLFLKVLEIRNKIPVTQIDGEYGITVNGYDMPTSKNFGIIKHHSTGKTYRNDMIKIFNDDILRALDYEN